MRILTIINKLDVGGAENLSVDLCNNLIDRDYKVDILALQDTNSFVKDKLNPSIGYQSLTMGSMYNPILVLKIIRVLKRYDIVHVHLFPSVYWVLISSFFSRGKFKIVFTEHSVYNRRRNILFFRILDRLLYKRLDSIICVSEGAKEALLSHIGSNNQKKLTVINNGIDILKFRNSSIPRYNFFPPDDFIIIQVSSFRMQKDQRTLIKALNHLPDKIKLLLVGDGEMKEELEQYVADQSLSQRVKFLGIRSDICGLLSYCSVVVLSSKHESFGLAVVEGMAAGKPIIATNIPGLQEIVNGHGLLFDREDDIDLSECILKLYEDNEFYNEISKKCLNRSEAFSLNKTVDEHVLLYRTLLGIN